MYKCESWTIKKAQRWRTDACELWCWRRLPRVPWTPRRSNQSILKEYSLEGLMLKMKFQYFGHLMRRIDSFENTLILAKTEERRREEKGTTKDEMVGWYHRLNGHEFEQALGVGNGQESLECWRAWGCKELDTTERLNWTERPSSLCGSDSKKYACSAADPGSVLRLVRPPGEGNGSPLQYSCLENSMGTGAWQVTVHGVTKSWTWLSDCHTQTYLVVNLKKKKG